MDNSDRIILCMEQSMYVTGYTFTCTDQNNRVFEVDQYFNFADPVGNLDFGDPLKYTNFGWLQDDTLDYYATGFGDFLYRNEATVGYSIKEATWTYFMPTSQAVKDSATYTLDERTIGNRWENGEEVELYICDIDNLTDDKCMGGTIVVCCNALQGWTTSLAIAAVLASVLF